MSSDQSIFEDQYTRGKPFVKVKIAIVNPENLRQTTIQGHFWIDTGFDGGIHVSQSYEAEITQLGVNIWPGGVGVAGGRTDLANRCLAYLQQIGDRELPAPGIEAEIIFHGQDRHGLLGLDILRNWIIKFDGPSQFFKITKP
jgi:hypothetical protein